MSENIVNRDAEIPVERERPSPLFAGVEFRPDSSTSRGWR
jgi:hypothetical protein